MMKPVKKSMRVDCDEQLNKIYEELDEVMDALFAYRQEKSDEALRDCAMELADVQIACETMLDMLGLDEIARNKIRDIVYRKNKDRGYYDEF